MRSFHNLIRLATWGTTNVEKIVKIKRSSGKNKIEIFMNWLKVAKVL